MPAKIVCDTNTLVSGLIWKGNESKLLAAVLERKATLFSSPELLVEFARVIHYERLRPFITNPTELVNTLQSMAVFVKPTETVTVVQDDPDDDKVLECALAASADFIVSGDKHLLTLKTFRGMPILTTKAAIDKLTID